MLEIRNLHTHYGASHIIQGIDLSVRDGEVFGVFGRNGVGKTTLLKTIAGWIKPTGGEIAFSGRADRRPAFGSHRAPRRRFRAGRPADFPRLDGRGEFDARIPAGARPIGAGNRAALQAVYKRFPRLLERRGQFGTTLSGGEQQMLAMARVMIGTPSLLLIDEPSEGLAPMIVADLFAIIEETEAGGMLDPPGRAERASGADGLRPSSSSSNAAQSS